MRFRHVLSAISEGVSSLMGTRDPLLPPRRLIDGVGGGDFKAVGREFFGHFTKIGGLQPGHRVLDVGCGCGRMAVPMIPFLEGTGEYRGFDIVPDAIQWSQEHITARHPRFHFALADVRSQAYNPNGKCQPHEYRFPYESDYFDFAFLTSVFTHMVTRDMEHYLTEIVRTLKPGGRCMINYFLLNAGAREGMSKGDSALLFPHALPGCFTRNLDEPEGAIAYEETAVRECFAKHGLAVSEPVHYGSWSGRKNYLSFQDIMLATKAGERLKSKTS